MKTKEFNIIKKNRVWIQATNNGYAVKIKACEKSKNLEEGKVYDLLVNDISIYSKYGTDVRYELEAEQVEEFCFFNHYKHNIHVVKCLKMLGGKWDAEGKTWAIPAFCEDSIDELELLYNSEKVAIEIVAKDTVAGYASAVYFLGYPIAEATGRDSGATISNNASLLEGIVTSGGSIVNWVTKILKGSKIRLTVPLQLLKESVDTIELDGEWSVKGVDGKVFCL